MVENLSKIDLDKMKKLLLALLLSPSMLFAQDKFSLKGQIDPKNNNKKIYLVHLEDSGEKIDSAIIKNGQFQLNIPLDKASIAILLLDHSGNALKSQNPKDIYRFFIEPGQASLQAKDSIANSTVKGLKIFEENTHIEKATKEVNVKLEALNKEFASLSESKKADQNVLLSFQKRYVSLMEERQTILKKFVSENPKSFISLYYLNSELASDEMNVPEIEQLYNALSDELKANIFGKMVKQRLDQGKITGIGVIASDFEEKTPEGISIKLSSFKGQYVLVDFWASWCMPCRQENPHLVEAYEKYKEKGFTILGVSIDQSADAWKQAIKTDGLLWAQLLDTTQKIAATYGIDAIPKNYLLDKNGKIIAKNLRGPALEEKLKEIFK